MCSRNERGYVCCHGMCVCVEVRGSQASILSSALFKTQSVICKNNWPLASGESRGSASLLAVGALRLQTCYPIWLHIDSEDVNSGAHTSVASTLLTGSSLPSSNTTWTLLVTMLCHNVKRLDIPK